VNVLEPYEQRSERTAALGQEGLGEGEVGSDLVERPVGANARGILGYARTPNETGLTAISGPGV
jgi:hypothetical protein